MLLVGGEEWLGHTKQHATPVVRPQIRIPEGAIGFRRFVESFRTHAPVTWNEPLAVIFCESVFTKSSHDRRAIFIQLQ